MATRERQQVTSYPTPLPIDLIFYEVRDKTLGKNSVWNYGDKHPNVDKYPNHILVLVTENTNKYAEGDERWYYAANRENQDLYNWTHSEADIGGTKFDAVTRFYVIRRDDFDPEEPTQGTLLENMPEDLFVGDHYLAERAVMKSDDEILASLFVMEKRTYVKKVPFIDIEINRETGDAKQIITTLYYRGELVGGIPIEDLVDDPEDDYWNLDVDGFGNVAKQLSENWWEVTQRQWINLEDIWEWELDRRGPKKFYCPSDETRTTETTTGNPPGPLSPLPTVPIGTMVSIIKWGGYMRYTVAERNASGLRAIDELRYMPDDGFAYPAQIELIDDDDVPSSRQAVTGSGVITEFEGIEGCLAVSETKQALSLEQETQEVASFLKPAKYLSGANTTDTTIDTATDGSLVMPSVTEGNEAELSVKGNIGKLRTTTQTGDIIALEGAEVNPQDGIGYATSDEAVPYAEVAPADIDASGNVTEFTPIDGNFARKTVRNIISIEDEVQEVSSFLRPEKYIPGVNTVSTLTETATDGSLVMTPATEGGQVVFENKGNISKLKTTTQEGVLIPLAGAQVNPQDGIAYDTLEEAVPYAEVANTNMDGDGNVTEFVPIDGNFARKVVSNALSTEEETKLIASRLPPDKFYVGGGSPETITTITVGDAPPAPSTPAIDEQVQFESKGRITRESVTTITGDPVALPATSFDQRTGVGYLEYQELVPIGDAEETNIDATGVIVTYEPYNADYCIKTTKRLASTLSKTWVDIINYEWPPVLLSVTFKTYPRRRGSPLVVPVLRFKQGYSGPQAATAVQYWQLGAITPTSPSPMIPEGFRHQDCYYTIDVPPCLHDEITLTTTTGTEDPIWEFISESETFDATNFTDWPDTITWIESKPYAGGYLVTEWTINKPF